MQNNFRRFNNFSPYNQTSNTRNGPLGRYGPGPYNRNNFN